MLLRSRIGTAAPVTGKFRSAESPAPGPEQQQRQKEGQRMSRNAELYSEDFYTWTQTTAALIRAGEWQDLDAQ